MDDLTAKIKQENATLRLQLERCRVENKSLLDLPDTGVSNGLANNELHQFNNTAALLDANIELALDSLLKLPRSEEPSHQNKIATIKNFLTAALSAKTDLVDIVNARQN